MGTVSTEWEAIHFEGTHTMKVRALHPREYGMWIWELDFLCNDYFIFIPLLWSNIEIVSDI